MILRHLYANKKILLDFRLLTGVDSSKIQLNITLKNSIKRNSSWREKKESI